MRRAFPASCISVKRLDTLEEQYRLALARQYAPKSEKRKDRLFNEVEEAAESGATDENDDVPALPDTGLPALDKSEPRKRGRKPLPADLPRERIEYDLPEDQKICPCCGKGMHRMGEEVSEHPRAFLGDYAGTLMTDGWPAWRTVKTATHLGCLARARRLFTDALKGQKNKPSPRITKALEFFQALYQVEVLAKQTLPEGETLTDYRYRLRQQHSVPLLTAFKAWLDELASKVLPQSLLGEAIGYCRRQWQYLIRYVDDGRLPLDNNVIERDIRPFATARKSWLFSDTVAGAKASAVVYSLMLTCRACGVEPHARLLHVLTELPQRAPDADISDLLPFNYAKRQAEVNVS
ncbi:hypothetical protein WL76_23425 [Burkholderia ubonensis]|nr:hypothetical protein WL76_23425 [Burkholderia ubonensis]